MKTRKDLYGQDAAEIIRVMSAYQTLYVKQVYGLFQGKEEKIKQVIKLLIQQDRIHMDEQFGLLYFHKPNPDYKMLKCFWVLLDFIEKIDFHIPASYPAIISYFAKQDIYEILYISSGEEKIIQYAVQTMLCNSPARRIVVVEQPEQIPNCIFDGVAGYCTVLQNGTVQYYQMN